MDTGTLLLLWALGAIIGIAVFIGFFIRALEAETPKDFFGSALAAALGLTLLCYSASMFWSLWPYG